MGKRLLSLTLCLGMVLSLAVIPAGAAPDMSYSVDRLDRSVWKSEGGMTAGIEIYYDLVQVLCSDQNVENRINAVLREGAEEFLQSAEGLDEYWDDPDSFLYDANNQNNGEYYYDDYVETKSICLDDHVLSICGEWMWWMGGTVNGGYDCYTFDRSTGELLTLPEYLGLSGEETLSLAYDTILSYYDYDELFVEDFFDTNPYELQYYVDNGGQVHLAFSSYEIGPGAMGWPDLVMDYSPNYNSTGNYGTGIEVTGGSFYDVPDTAWYAQDVRDIQQYGLIYGVGNNLFDPQGTLSLAQAITLAVRVHAQFNSLDIPEQGSPWYQPYLDYADLTGICSYGEFGTDYNGECSRLTMAVLFQRVFPTYTEDYRNSIGSLPDVEDSGYGSSVFYLYRQGVLTGNDAQGTFRPYNSITRAEAAAILNRVMNVEKRKTFALTTSDTSVYPVDLVGITVGELKNILGNDLSVETEGVWYGSIANVWYEDGRIPGLFYAGDYSDIMAGHSLDHYVISAIEGPYRYGENYMLSSDLWAQMTMGEIMSSGYQYDVYESFDPVESEGVAASCTVYYNEKIYVIYRWYFLDDDYLIYPDPMSDFADEVIVSYVRDT